MTTCTNVERAERFAQALQVFAPNVDLTQLGTIEAEELITDLCADMQHWHQRQFGCLAPDRYEVGRTFFNAEHGELS